MTLRFASFALLLALLFSAGRAQPNSAARGSVSSSHTTSGDAAITTAAGRSPANASVARSNGRSNSVATSAFTNWDSIGGSHCLNDGTLCSSDEKCCSGFCDKSLHGDAPAQHNVGICAPHPPDPPSPCTIDTFTATVNGGTPSGETDATQSNLQTALSANGVTQGSSLVITICKGTTVAISGDPLSTAAGIMTTIQCSSVVDPTTPGATSECTLDGQGSMQVLNVPAGSTAKMTGLAVINGIRLNPNFGGGSGFPGGGARVEGELTCDQCAFLNNKSPAVNADQSDAACDSAGAGVGGAVAVLPGTGGGVGKFTATRTVFKGNTAGSGGAVSVGEDNNNAGTSFTCAQCQFIENKATGCTIDNGGGALRVSETATVSDSVFTGNTATNSLRALELVGGGAVFMARSSSLYDSSGNTYSSNSAQLGGAIYARGKLTLPLGNTFDIINTNTALTSRGALFPACGAFGIPSACGNNVYLNALGDGIPVDLASAATVGGCIPSLTTADFNCAGCTTSAGTCPFACNGQC